MADTAWIAVVAGKGGVGKTTTTINLAAALAEAGLPCLVVDCDPQSNLTAGLGHNPYQLAVTVADVITGRSTSAEAIVQTAWENLDVLPASPNLTTVEEEIATSLGKELRLRDALRCDESVSRYRVVFFDTPPSFGFHTLSAMAAAQYVLVPLQMSGFALRGLKEVIRAVGAAQTRLNPSLQLLGAVHTFVSRTRFTRELRGALSEVAPIRAFEATISQAVKLQETALVAQPVTDYASKSKPADEYRSLARELLDALPGAVHDDAAPTTSDAEGMEEPRACMVEAVAAIEPGSDHTDGHTRGDDDGHDSGCDENPSPVEEALEQRHPMPEVDHGAAVAAGSEDVLAVDPVAAWTLRAAGVELDGRATSPARGWSPFRRVAGRIHRRCG
jgi:chromosome partitioning protein